jgi:lipoprotein-anchoring transpeptidase ErfK/SrfK
MGPKTKVFDIWGNTAGQTVLAYAAPALAPPSGQFLSDFLSAKVKKVPQPAVPPEPELPAKPQQPPPEEPEEQLPEELEKKKLELWKQAIQKAKNGRAKPEAPKKPPPRPPFWKHWYIGLSGALGIALLLVAVLFLFVFDRSLAPVYLGSMKINSNVAPAALQKQIATAAANYAISFKDTDGKVTGYPLNQTGISIDTKTSATLTKSQLSRKWVDRLQWWKPIRLSLATKTDKDVFQNFINESVIKADQPYQNAGLNIGDGAVGITPEAAGKGRTIKYPTVTIGDAIANLHSSPIQLQALNIPAPITAGDLKDEKVRLEAILAQKITLHIDSANVTAKPADIAGWLDLNPVEHDKTIDITVNSGRVLAYLNKIAAYYIQPPRSRLIMTNADGSQTVLDSGANGVDIVNKDKTATDLAAKILAAKGADQTLDISYAQAQTIEVQPYAKWIVVDVTTKRMYAYEQSTMVKSFLVSAGAPKTPTVLGQFSIYAKYDVQDMRGSNADGSRYFQPNVQWVNYFYKDYAIHGNYWRPLSYFGNVNSSHGCVGVVNDDAKWIYDWAPIGTPVIVHQ